MESEYPLEGGHGDFDFNRYDMAELIRKKGELVETIDEYKQRLDRGEFELGERLRVVMDYTRVRMELRNIEVQIKSLSDMGY